MTTAYEAVTAALEWLTRQFTITFITGNRYKLFLTGLRNTLIIAFGAVIIGTFIGAVVAMIRVYSAQSGKLRALDKLCGAYLAVFRGTPIVVQLLIMYYIVFSFIDNGISIAVLAFGINSGAYVAEIVRAGILAVDIGQTEAGRSLGLSSGKTMRLIVLPQAIKNILPALGNELIALLKDTSVAGYVTVKDLAQAGENVRTLTAEPYFSLLFVAAVYFLLVMGITKILRIAERRLAKSDRH
ncbi:MAG: amino acid ABC transporter permease [Oscillospiraceae bacterium]|jgi:His/Glu/Gln/Arg/opine family amino acid ABC transporter permease subunit|nr:amino acid ABC transporter permease [Oscillospiraceae bacterium]